MKIKVCGLFLILFLISCLAGCSISEGASFTVGRTSGTATYSSSTENQIHSGFYVNTTTGVADSVFFNMKGAAGGNRTKAALYKWSGTDSTLIDTSAERVLTLTTSYVWYGFALLNAKTITINDSLVFRVWSNDSTGNAAMGIISSTGQKHHYRELTYGTWVTPSTGGTWEANYNEICNMVGHTVATGNPHSRIIKKLLLEGD